MQDAYQIVLPLDFEKERSRIIKEKEKEPKVRGKENIGYFAVFDGHGGDNVCNYAKKHMHNHLHQVLPKDLSDAVPLEERKKGISKALLETFRNTDNEILKEAKKNVWQDGSTAIVALITNNLLSIANVGDCKAILVRANVKKVKSQESESSVRNSEHNNQSIKNSNQDQKQSSPQPQSQSENQNQNQKDYRHLLLTKDHNPMDWDERKRIQKAGGQVKDGRVMGMLEVSRALGDQKFKAFGVTADPDIAQRILIQPDDSFLILACDGLWKGISVNDAVSFVWSGLEKYGENDKEKHRQEICNALVMESIKQGSTDNVTAILVFFDNHV